MEELLPAVIRRYLLAYNSKDVNALLATLSEDVTFENITNSGESTRTDGKAALEVLARNTVGVFSSRRQKVVDAVVETSRVALRVEFEAVVAIDLPNGWKAGQHIQIRGASFFTLQDGLIARIVDIS